MSSLSNISYISSGWTWYKSPPIYILILFLAIVAVLTIFEVVMGRGRNGGWEAFRTLPVLRDSCNTRVILC